MSILKRTRPELVVVGGGPAGMAAALFAAQSGCRVLLLERNEKLGKKLYITGKGRCNLCNTADMEETLRNIPRNPRFMRAALSAFDAADLRGLMEELGVPTMEERGGRVFPVSEKASDVTRALERALIRAGVELRFHARVAGLLSREDGVCGVELADGKQCLGDAVILATGGASYPMTGSTGDGFRLAAQVGHRVYEPQPSLVPLLCGEPWVLGLQGLSLRNVKLSARLAGKTLFCELGELLFTHNGISGPLVISLSSYLSQGDFQKLQVCLDLKPGLDAEQLHQRILRDFAQNPRKQLSSILPGLLPARLAEAFSGLCELDPGKTASQISKEERQRLVDRLKALPIPVQGLGSLTEAIITRGGVDTGEIVPATMASRLMPGLFFCGELIDVDALTGGFNLTVAFSTGAAAGRGAAAWALKKAEASCRLGNHEPDLPDNGP